MSSRADEIGRDSVTEERRLPAVKSRSNVLSFDALVAFPDLFPPCPKGQLLFDATYCLQLPVDIRARLALYLCVLRKGL